MKRKANIQLIMHHLLDKGLWFNHIKNDFLIAFSDCPTLYLMLKDKSATDIETMLSDIKKAKETQKFFNQLYF